MTADARQSAREANASVAAVCRALGLNPSTVYARANAVLGARCMSPCARSAAADVRAIHAAPDPGAGLVYVVLPPRAKTHGQHGGAVQALGCGALRGRHSAGNLADCASVGDNLELFKL